MVRIGALGRRARHHDDGQGPEFRVRRAGRDDRHEPLADFFDTNFIHFGFTNGGQPLAFAVGSAVIEAYQEDALVERSAELGRCCAAELLALQVRHRSVGDVRALGLMGAMELTRDRATRESLISSIEPVSYSAPSPLEP